jgi:hypothetical protein
MLGMMTEADEFFAKANARKSLLNRIERVKHRHDKPADDGVVGDLSKMTIETG